MLDEDPLVDAAVAAHREGRYADALPLLQQLFAEEDAGITAAPGRYFITMFNWKLLVDAYPPARDAVLALRDGQAARLVAGDVHFGTPRGAIPADSCAGQKTRFSVIAKINDFAGDLQATHALFAQLDQSTPALARQYAYLALPAVVAAGDFALADRYRRDPLAQLDEINALAQTFPLFPVPMSAPRLAATLTGLVGEVALASAVLDGLGRPLEAEAVRAALLAGLHDTALRDLAQRELDAPGTITRAVVAHQMALEQPAPPDAT